MDKRYRPNAILLAMLLLLLPALQACNLLLPLPPAGGSQPAQGGIERVALEEAKAAFDSGAAVFVDVRSATDYAESHIPGARSMPLPELESHLDELEPADWIITYCT